MTDDTLSPLQNARHPQLLAHRQRLIDARATCRAPLDHFRALLARAKRRRVIWRRRIERKGRCR